MAEQSGENLIQKLDSNMSINPIEDQGIKWLSPMEAPFRILGFPWLSKERTYRRMPMVCTPPIPEAVNYLANCTAGGQIHFQTDSKELLIAVQLQAPANMVHMPATGQCGFDCYVDFGHGDGFQFCNVTRYPLEQDHYKIQLLDLESSKMRKVILNFPLYQGVKEVFIGVQKDATILGSSDFQQNPLIFYGTSITQGGCASRPGLAYTNILSRYLQRECINLGFSGNGKGEAEVAKVISSIPNPGGLILDYEANCMSTELYKQTLPKFIHTYRKVHPLVPILVISRIQSSMDIISPTFHEERLERKEFQKSWIHEEQKNGDQNLHFYDGSYLLGEQWLEGTVDGVHPTDLGFMSMANTLYPVIREIF
ncbi:MAG: hypothetical protein GX962_10360 [Epulopiscium sp.]|nr:hypothetical protein [Candidatus Epulonipiscium sp.]